MKVQTDEKAVLEQAIKIHLNDINYDNFNEDAVARVLKAYVEALFA